MVILIGMLFVSANAGNFRAAQHPSISQITINIFPQGTEFDD